jgi:hypothetical protein
MDRRISRPKIAIKNLTISLARVVSFPQREEEKRRKAKTASYFLAL